MEDDWAGHIWAGRISRRVANRHVQGSCVSHVAGHYCQNSGGKQIHEINSIES
jgi:hypothetical protein